MVLWRISRHSDLTGTGGLRAPGRWHYQGHPIVYLASSPAAALLEICVHTSANRPPPDFTLLKVEGSGKVLSARDNLPEDWSSNTEFTRDFGTAWLRKKASVLLEVPSAMVPETCNFLLNPSRPEARQFVVAGVYSYPFDPRLKA